MRINCDKVGGWLVIVLCIGFLLIAVALLIWS